MPKEKTPPRTPHAGIRKRDLNVANQGVDVKDQQMMSASKKVKREITKGDANAPAFTIGTARKSLVAQGGTPLRDNTAYLNRPKIGHVELTTNGHIRDLNDVDMKGNADMLADISSEEGCEIRVVRGPDREISPEAAEDAIKYYMHTPPSDRSKTAEKQLLEHSERIRSEYGLSAFSSLGNPSQDTITVCGRVRVERFPGEAEGKTSDPKLSERQGIMLEGSMAHSNGALVRLDVSHLPRLSLFRGQIVVVQGVSSNGSILVAKRIFAGVSPPTRDLSDVPDHVMNQTQSIWVANGPFTLPCDLEFKPLRDLLNRVQSCKVRKPDAVILQGPFVPEKHPKIAKGDVVMDFGNGETYEASFSELFHLKIATLLSEFVTQTGCKTKFCLVPSTEDVHHPCVYPQPPFKRSLFESDEGMDLSHGGQIVRLPNPALVRVGNVVIGLNSADVPVHLIRSGDVNRYAASSGTSRPHRFERFAEHLVTQQSFYPLSPPDKSIPLDEAYRAKHLAIPVRPDFIVTRSNLSHFAKTYGDTVFVNPGMLVRHGSGGTFAKLTVMPPTQRDAASNTNVVKKEGTRKTIEPATRRTRIDVVRI